MDEAERELLFYPPTKKWMGIAVNGTCRHLCFFRFFPPAIILSQVGRLARAHGGHMGITQEDKLRRAIFASMSKSAMEFATARARLYPSTYEKITALARKRRTSIARIVDEKFKRGR